MLIIDVNTESMYRSYMNCAVDHLWDSQKFGESLPPILAQLSKHLEYLVYERFDGIREMFSEGYTCLLIPDEMEWLETSTDVDIMVRVFNCKGVLIGSLTKEQLNW